MSIQGKPEFSVVIPSYNHEKYIGSAIKSVINQTFKEWELVIIDDGSKDNSREIIRSYSDPRIRFFVQENHDAPYTINRGIQEARGERIAILNSDDTFEPKKLEESHKFFEQGYEFVFGKLHVINEKGEKLGDENESARWINMQLNNSKEPDTINKLLNRLSYLVTTTNFVFRKAIVDDVGYFHEKLHYAHDFNFLTKVFKNEKKIKFIPEYLSSYRIHSANTISKGQLESYLELCYSISKTLRSGSDILGRISPEFFHSPIISNVVLFYSLFSEEEVEEIIGERDNINRKRLLEFIDNLFKYQSINPYEDVPFNKETDLRPILIRKNYESSLLKQDLHKIRTSLRWKIPNYVYKKFPHFSDNLAQAIKFVSRNKL